MGIERLELCVRFCNIAGLFPFRMVLNRFNGKFLRFESHWRHPANWWLILSITVHFLQGSFIIYLGLLNLFYNLIRALPTAALVAYVFDLLNFVLFGFITRLLLLRFRHLEKAFNQLKKIDRLFFDKFCYSFSCKTRRRTLIGIVSSVIYVVCKIVYELRLTI